MVPNHDRVLDLGDVHQPRSTPFQPTQAHARVYPSPESQGLPSSLRQRNARDDVDDPQGNEPGLEPGT